MSDRPVIDLSGGNYDDLENKLSQTLGIKIMLVRDWQTPRSYYTAQANNTFANMYPGGKGLENARQAFNQATQSVIDSLRANITARDPQLAAELTDTEIHALHQVRHLTHRRGNCEPESAVIIFDPANIYDESDTTWNKPVYWTLFGQSGYQNAWVNRNNTDDEKGPYIRDFVENLDVSDEDRRAYQALLDVRYALMHQNESTGIGKGVYYEPYFYKLCKLAADKPGMHAPASEIGLDALKERLEPEQFGASLLQAAGVKDKDFLEKLVLGHAIGDMGHTASFPFQTYVRLSQRERQFAALTPDDMGNIQQRLGKKLDEALEAKGARTGVNGDIDSGTYIFMPLSDCRVLFPIFREVYEQDKSTGAERVYMDTIMKGLQRYFPTLTNGPVPVLDPAKEPPLTLKGYKKAQDMKPDSPQPPSL